MMHPYATNSSERARIPLSIAAVSVLAAWGLHHLDIPWWVEAPSVIGFYGIFYALFDRWIWSVGLLHKVGLVRIPDLRGRWTGYVVSSFHDHETKISARLDIRQRWNAVLITMDSADSESHSMTASLTIGEGGSVLLTYTFFNEPRAGAVPEMQPHRGTAWATLSGAEEGQVVLEGEYYSGRGRQNIGSLRFERLARGS